ncbi:MAG: 3-deoxy-8-phosphooctulonate synthase [Leptospiraceae bacterium]|nr:3-deoxy-8-phosphooctulonate synthase [Leptospiraceae bacterium]
MTLVNRRPFLQKTEIGADRPFFVIAGPCVIESRDLLARVCEPMLAVCQKLGIPYVFKSSFDKANRSSIGSRRGPGLEEGLRDLEYIKSTFGVPLLTDVHAVDQVQSVAQVVDILQIPAFLSRQTDLVVACARTNAWVNVKKGQFLAPADCVPIVEKIRSSGSERYLITERGATFGYNNLVFDPRSMEILHRADIPVIMDATHSTQLPGGGAESGGNREYVPLMARTAVAAGIEGLFMEVHPDPDKAWSDASNQYPLARAPELIERLFALDQMIKQSGGLLANY